MAGVRHRSTQMTTLVPRAIRRRHECKAIFFRLWWPGVDIRNRSRRQSRSRPSLKSPCLAETIGQYIWSGLTPSSLNRILIKEAPVGNWTSEEPVFASSMLKPLAQEAVPAATFRMSRGFEPRLAPGQCRGKRPMRVRHVLNCAMDIWKRINTSASPRPSWYLGIVLAILGASSLSSLSGTAKPRTFPCHWTLEHGCDSRGVSPSAMESNWWIWRVITNPPAIMSPSERLPSRS